MKRKILMILLTFSMSAAVLAGCSKDDTKTTEKNNNTTNDAFRTEADEDDIDTPEDTEKTLSDYFAEPGVKEQMDADVETAKTTYASKYTDISYEINGNTITYIYVYKDPIPEEFHEQMDSYIVAEIKNQKVIGAIEQLEQQSGVKGVSVQYIYRNPDGTDIFNETYSK